MLASILILILILPAAFLPVALDAFGSGTSLVEMGIHLEVSDDTIPLQGYEPVGFLSTSDHFEDWEVNEPLQVRQ